MVDRLYAIISDVDTASRPLLSQRATMSPTYQPNPRNSNVLRYNLNEYYDRHEDEAKHGTTPQNNRTPKDYRIDGSRAEHLIY